MDLLYFLQTVRLYLPDWINTVFVLISESVLILAPAAGALVYWCIDKKKGTYIICVFASAMLLNELLKLSFCIYRPWILDSRLTPAPQVTGTATNYSFPSSHSCAVASILVSLALAFPENRKLPVFSVVFSLLVMFCRMYLGCHTPKDVACGALIGTLSAFLFRPMLCETFDEDRFQRRLLPVTCTLTVLSILYILLKPYPYNYQADGSVLVDPVAMRPDTFGFCGVMFGTGLGLFLERKRIRFALPESRKAAVRRAVPGFLAFALLFLLILKKLLGFLDPATAKFLRYAICILFVCAGYPALCKKLQI